MVAELCCVGPRRRTPRRVRTPTAGRATGDCVMHSSPDAQTHLRLRTTHPSIIAPKTQEIINCAMEAKIGSDVMTTAPRTRFRPSLGLLRPTTSQVKTTTKTRQNL